MNRLQLNVSLGETDSFSGMGSTYRDEGLSVGPDHMRFNGEEIEMEVKFSDLRIGKKIGHGACSTVNIASHVVSGDLYAVKMFNVYDSNQAAQLVKEISLLTKAQDCDALISLKGAFHMEGSIGMIIEYMDKGSIEYMLRPEVHLREEVIAATIYQIIWGLGYLHYDNRLHRDLKPANVLFNSNGQVKLADFGIAKELESSREMSGTAVGTFKYMSPERLLGQRYDKSGDIWSVGIIILELWSKQYPFSHCCSTPIDLVAELEGMNLSQIIRSYPEPLKEVLRLVLSRDPHRRATCSDLINCQWFQQFGLTCLENAQEIIAEWLDGVEHGNSSSSNSKTETKSMGSPGELSFTPREVYDTYPGDHYNSSQHQDAPASRRKSRGRSYAEDYNDEERRSSFCGNVSNLHGGGHRDESKSRYK